MITIITTTIMTMNTTMSIDARSAARIRLDEEHQDGPTAAAHSAPAALGHGAETAEVLDPAALYRLMTWFSPSFPVGSFAYSSGIEWAVEAGSITNAATLRDWLATLLAHGSGFADAILAAHAYRAASACDRAALSDIAELAAALAPSKERQLETLAQGGAFVEIVRNAWSCDRLIQVLDGWDQPVAYPVAVGLAGAAHGVPLAPLLHAFLHALVANWISAGVRLIPLGQTEGQQVLAALEPDVAAIARRALDASLDDLGSATFCADLASMNHEAQYTRLFRS